MFAIEEAHIVLAVLAASVVLFVTEALRYDLVAIGVALVLVLTGCLEPDEALRGFSSEAVVLIASMYVFGEAMVKSGVSGYVGSRFLERGIRSEIGLVVRISVLAGLLSSVLSNTGVVAMLIPVCSGLARTRRIPVSRILMPLAFGSLVGGLVTIVGTSTNIIVNEEIARASAMPFGVFDFSHLGLVLLGVTTLFFLGPGRWLLPVSPVDSSLSERYQVPKFVTEVLIEPSSTLINRAVADVDLFRRHNVTVLGIVRAGGESPVMAPGPYNRVRAEDTLILQGAPDDLLRLSLEIPLKERSHVDTATTRLYSDDVKLVEAVIPGGSSLVGQTLSTSEFRSRTNLNVLAMRKHGELQLERLQNTVMDVGDTLLVQGHERDIERSRREREVLVLDEVEPPRFGRHAWISSGLLLAVLVLGAVTDVSLAILAASGAMLLILTRAVRADQVSRVVDWSVLALVGGMLALGEAFKRWGLSDTVASWLVGLGAEGLSPQQILLVLIVATVLLTQVLANVATAAIMAPVAMELGTTMGVSDRPFLMAVITGASLAFLSPVAHQANAMVMGPGGYRYKDYIVVGLPLAAVTVAVSAVLIPVFWPF